MVDRLNNKKKVICLSLLGISFQATAEVLVILPESGPMARAGNSIKLGIMSAQQSSASKLPLKFVNSDQRRIKDIVKRHVNRQTKMIIGPLARQDVEALIKENPRVPVLSLNEVSSSHRNVWQFSLSKDADAEALLNVIHRDKIQQMYILRQEGTEAESLSFVNALYKKFPGHVSLVKQVPKLNEKQGLLLLGNNTWTNSFKNLPKRNLYAQAIAIEDSQPLPVGLKFCDVPGIYQAKWQDVINVYKSNPTSLAFQRLYAFGGDAWHIAEQFVLHPQVKNLSFHGRTGQILIENDHIQRTPSCYVNTRKGLAPL